MTNTDITAHLPPMERHPFEFPFGLFIADSHAYGGAHGFAWFKDAAKAQDYLCNEHWRHYEPDENEGEGVRGTIAKALKDTVADKALPCDRINAAQDTFELRWAGDFDQLWLGDSEFEREIQREYRENIFGLERGMSDDLSEDHDRAEHLQHYCG